MNVLVKEIPPKSIFNLFVQVLVSLIKQSFLYHCWNWNSCTSMALGKDTLEVTEWFFQMQSSNGK